MSRRLTSVTPRFVEYIPTEGEDLLPGAVYISMKHGMVVHRCPCGCGQLSEFMLDPIRHRMEFDGESVSFEPSIGNSNLGCGSHYWIRANQIRWCAPMDPWATERAKKRELARVLEARGAMDGTKKTRMRRLWARVSDWWAR